MADCPECEYCCAIGLCCPPEKQEAALVDIMTAATGKSADECREYAKAIVAARMKAMHHHE